MIVKYNALTSPENENSVYERLYHDELSAKIAKRIIKEQTHLDMSIEERFFCTRQDIRDLMSRAYLELESSDEKWDEILDSMISKKASITKVK